MSSQRAFDGAGAFSAEVRDPVFEPSAEFNFEEGSNHIMMFGNYNTQGDFDFYDGNMQPEYPISSSALNRGLSAVSPPGGWQNPFSQTFAADSVLPASTQSQIVDNRVDSVTQFCGQITPPGNESTGNQTSNLKQAQESDAVKREERARNAAKKRHAKSKKPSIGRESYDGDENASEDRGERQAHYREKNRVAAAKCRAKKKNHNDDLEEIHRDEASKNRILKAELMGLRNELAQVKGLTLEHSPDSCQCHGIHKYSIRQAHIIARGAAPQYGYRTASPAQKSSQSADTPVSEATGDGLVSVHERMSPAMGNVSRRMSSFAPGSWMQPA